MRGSRLMRAFAVVSLAGAVMTIAGSPAVAGAPTDVTIVSPIDLTTNTGSFDVVTDEGSELCDGGSVENVSAVFVGGQSGTHAQILVVHEFTCDDGSGSFLLSLRVRLDFATGTTTGSWSALAGTGDYEKLHASGSVVGTPSCGADCILDTYTGAVHID